MKNIIFCLSYLSLNQTIVLLEKHGVENVKIITSNRNIEKFFSLVYGNKKIIYFLESSSITLPKRLHQYILFPIRFFNVIAKKKKAWRFFKKIENSQIYFFFNSAAFFHAWLIYKLSKNNTLHYQEDLNLDSFKQLNTLEAYINKKFIKFFYSEEVIPLNQQFAITYKMSKEFLNKCGVQALDIDYCSTEISSIISSKLNFPHGEVLYLPPLIDEVKVSHNLYIDFVDTIIDYCGSKNIKIHLKRHPRSLEKYSKENQLFEIPAYYPASCLTDYNVTIGLGTATLYEVANRGGVSVSLVKILMKDDLNLINFTMNYLKSNLDKGKEIIFPDSITELNKLIYNYIFV